MASNDTCARVTGISTVGIPVVDQDRALRFYVETLGFDVRRDIPIGDGARWVEVAPPGADVSLALERAHHGHPAGVETGVRLTTDDADEGARGAAGPWRQRRGRVALAGRSPHVRLPRSGRQRARDRRGLSAHGRGRTRS